MTMAALPSTSIVRNVEAVKRLIQIFYTSLFRFIDCGGERYLFIMHIGIGRYWSSLVGADRLA
jgi:hypothetical protein